MQILPLSAEFFRNTAAEAAKSSLCPPPVLFYAFSSVFSSAYIFALFSVHAAVFVLVFFSVSVYFLLSVLLDNLGKLYVFQQVLPLKMWKTAFFDLILSAFLWKTSWKMLKTLNSSIWNFTPVFDRFFKKNCFSLSLKKIIYCFLYI